MSNPTRDPASVERMPFSSEALTRLEEMPDVTIVGWVESDYARGLRGTIFIAPREPIGFRDEAAQTAFANYLGTTTGLMYDHDGEWTTHNAYFMHGQLMPAHLQDYQTGSRIILYPGIPLAETALDDQLRYRLAYLQTGRGRDESPLLYRIRETDAPESYDVYNKGYGRWVHLFNWLGERAMDVKSSLGL